MTTKLDFDNVKIATEEQQLLALGRDRGWKVSVLGHAPMPSEQIRIGGWLIVPSHLDSSPIPVRAMKRIQAIYAAGLRPKGFVLVHEAPPLLPTSVLEAPSALGNISPNANLDQIKGIARAGAGVLGTVAVATGAVALGVAALLLLLPALLIAGVLVLDPILIAVMEDDAWIEIDRWEL